MKTQQWILANKPTDLPELEGPNQTFKLVENDLPELEDDELLVKTIYLSNDPAQRRWIAKNDNPERLYTAPVEEGSLMNAFGLAEVIESKSSTFQKGETVITFVGWSAYRVVDVKVCRPAKELPGGLSKTHYLGGLGPTGLTAYFGLKEVVRTEAKDSVVISGAAGATGSMAVQIAKHLIGCKRVIGIAGSDEKCKWVESLGADVCVNYKKSSFVDDLKKAIDGLVDVYFDNVGGEQLDLMFTLMAKYGRIAACGAISNYNNPKEKMTGLKNWIDVISMSIEIRGFILRNYATQWAEGLDTLKKGIQDGKIKLDGQSEHVVETGFEGVPKIWMGLFEGANTGKLITKVK